MSKGKEWLAIYRRHNTNGQKKCLKRCLASPVTREMQNKTEKPLVTLAERKYLTMAQLILVA